MDELTLGYERRITDRYRFGVLGTYRSLGQAFTSAGNSPDETAIWIPSP